MPTRKEVQDTYYERTGKASDISRQLAFAGIAIVWIFRKENGGAIHLDGDLVRVAMLLIAALACDLLQYVVAGAIFGWINRHEEKRGVKLADTIDLSVRVNWPANAFYWGKFAFVAIAYALLLIASGQRLT